MTENNIISKIKFQRTLNLNIISNISKQFGKNISENEGTLLNSDCPNVACPANGACPNYWRGTTFTTDHGIANNIIEPDTSIKLDCKGQSKC